MSRYAKKRRVLPIVLTVVLVILVVLAALVLWVASSVKVEIALNGEKNVALEYGESYSDPGAAAKLKSDLLGYEMSIAVDADMPLIQGKPGSHTVTYTAEFLWIRAVAERVVTITDSVAPVIELVSDPNSYTLPGHEYQEEGFTATDNCDGDITDKVVCTMEGSEMVYTVSDSSGNTAQARRTIVYSDPVAPELTLEGDTQITIDAGTDYQDPGFSAADNLDGDLTGSVTVTGSVDVYTADTYTVTYTVSDAAGNVTTATRTVTVVAKPQKDNPNTDGKVIYLTFDDGPGKHTERLLEILEKYNVKATFFVVKTGYINLLPKITEAGHAIAVHTATHNYGQIYASESAFFKDYETIHSIIEEKTGVNTTLMRFPGGSSNNISKNYCVGIMTKLTKAVEERGLQYFDWNVDSNDAGGAKTADEVFNNVTKGCANKQYSVVLMHDIHKWTVDAIERILIWGIANGYTFLPLDAASPTCHHGVNN